MKRALILALALTAGSLGILSASISTSSTAMAQATGGGGRGGGGGGGGGGGQGGEGGINDLHLFFQQDRARRLPAVIPPSNCTAGALCAKADPPPPDGCGADARPVRRAGRLFCESRRP